MLAKGTEKEGCNHPSQGSAPPLSWASMKRYVLRDEGYWLVCRSPRPTCSVDPWGQPAVPGRRHHRPDSASNMHAYFSFLPCLQLLFKFGFVITKSCELFKCHHKQLVRALHLNSCILISQISMEKTALSTCLQPLCCSSCTSLLI